VVQIVLKVQTVQNVLKRLKRLERFEPRLSAPGSHLASSLFNRTAESGLNQARALTVSDWIDPVCRARR
jgi:hypothetical protein